MYNPNSKDHLKLTLIDFNVSKRFKDPKTTSPLLMMTNTGNPKYQAPEML
jgi:serine/threonine protein kinase